MRQQDRITESLQAGGHEPLVACVLVSWNNWEHTERCLRALALQTYGQLQIIVVDNGSTDDSLIRIRSTYPSVLCIENGYNAGFAKACNVGARRAMESGAEFLWFLNNDTDAPPDTAQKLVSVALQDTTVGIVGAVLFYMHEPGSVQAWGGGEIDLWSGYNRHFTTPHALNKKHTSLSPVRWFDARPLKSWAACGSASSCTSKMWISAFVQGRLDGPWPSLKILRFDTPRTAVATGARRVVP